MDGNESYQLGLQKEIKYWTNLISSHKKNSNVSGYRKISSNSPSAQFVWNKAKIGTTESSGKNLPVSTKYKATKTQKFSNAKAFNHSSLRFTSSTPSLCSSSFVKSSNNGYEIYSSPNKISYKWKKTNSTSNVKQNLFSLKKDNVVFGNKSSSLLSKSQSMPVLNKDSFKWKNPGSISNSELRANMQKQSGIKKLSLSSSTSVLPSSSSSKVVKPKRLNCHHVSKTQKDKSRYTWNISTKAASRSTFSISSPSVKKLLVAKLISPHTRHKYIKRRKSLEKYRYSSSNSLSKTLYLRKKILSKYKLLQTPVSRSSVNMSKNPYKVIKKTVMSPNKHPYRGSFPRHSSYRTTKQNSYQPRWKGFRRNVGSKHKMRSRNFTNRRSKIYESRNRFKYICRNVQTRSRSSGNIVLRRKQQPIKGVASRRTNLMSSTPTFTQRLASNALHRSLEAARLKNRHKLKKVYCIFYNRFGKCNRGEKCPYTHDPDRVAICTQFLRGTCRNSSCPFSHKTSKQKMPVCTFFLRGNCSASNCPYLHVFLGRDALVCKTFATTGYCSKADQCKNLHLRVCPDFYTTGKCKGKCNLPHRRKYTRAATSTKSKPVKEDGFISLLKPKPATQQTLPVDNSVSAMRDVRIQPRLKLRKLTK